MRVLAKENYKAEMRCAALQCQKNENQRILTKFSELGLV